MCNQTITNETLMDSPAVDETPRVKFLCSFGGSIMPRPQDGKLRYVGGETRIVSLPRDVNFDELISRMRELFEAAVVLKYQQPDEDLDALVSVVNDDDVVNMMEEYDKLGAGDGFTRLRMFLFPSPPEQLQQQDGSFSSSSPNERDSERRYVDALNSLNDIGSDLRISPDSPGMGGAVAGDLLNSVNIEFGLHSQRNLEVPLPQFNLRHLRIPHLGSVQQQQQQQPQQQHTQRYSEMEAPWSPAYYSPRHHGHHETRHVTEFPASPSSGRYRMPGFGEFSDRSAEEYGRQSFSHQPQPQPQPQPQYDNQQNFVDNVVWLPAGAMPSDSGGFPVNLGHSHNAFEGNNSVCEHCRMNFQRNQNSVDANRYPDPRWMPAPPHHLDPPNAGNEFHQFGSPPCAECNHSREAYVINPDASLEPGAYIKEQSDPRSFYSEAHNHERGWSPHHHLNHRGEEPRINMPAGGWKKEQYVVDGTIVNGPIAQSNCGHHVSPNFINHDDARYIRAGPEVGKEVFHEHAVLAGPHILNPPLEEHGIRYGPIPQGTSVNGPIAQSNCGHQLPPHQLPPNFINHDDPRYARTGPELVKEGFREHSVGSGPHIQIPPPEDHGTRYGNFPTAYGIDNAYQMPHGAPSTHAIWMKVPNPMRASPSYEALNMLPQANGTVSSGFQRGSPSSSSYRAGMDTSNPWAGHSQKIYGFDGAAAPEYFHGCAPVLNSNALGQENQPLHAVPMESVPPMRASPSYEALNMLPQANGTVSSGFQRGSPSSSSHRAGMDTSNPWVGHSQKIYGFDGAAAPEYLHGCAPVLNSNALGQENQPLHAVPMESVPKLLSSLVLNDVMNDTTTSNYSPRLPDDTDPAGTVGLETKSMPGESREAKFAEAPEDSDVPNSSLPDKDLLVDQENKEDCLESNGTKHSEDIADIMKLCETDGPSIWYAGGFSVQRLSFLPELIASVKKAALEGAEDVQVRVQEEGENDVDTISKEATEHELEAEVATHVDGEVDSDSDHPEVSGIEQTKAEEEALAKGLQTIRNDDLEEIRELGTGTFGAVYYGKWKGSDVAIKRIKASCFAGRPSERERLIADFWKEALILSSLHHPNVVSFYGIVRDGPDRSLATVTEFMVNGSLKQFLQKKDRTIDRRKRLIIAMDTAFGMEYLHGKNIVHFDLKCENLLVNMRDPHRPICKIGDMGLSKVKQHTLVSGGVRGTLPWMAPELLSGKSNMVSEKIDVYSFGIVMWELLTGEEPYADLHCASIIGGIVNDSLRPQIPSWCDPEWKSLMESCWASDPGERPSFSEISQKLRKMAAAMNLK